MEEGINSFKIALIYPYYGEWPWYFDFFIKSCAYNPEITFIMVSDIAPPKEYPKNIKFIPKSLNDIEDIASSKLGFKVSLNRGYKLCDFKPAYGYLFEDILSGFDFWGHGDIDLIFGRIQNFIDSKVLCSYDTISVRHEYPSGFFLLYRNIPEVNGLFMKSKDYKLVFTSNTHYCFDECNFQHASLVNGVDIFDTKSSIESMMHVIKKAERDNTIRSYFDFCVCEGIPGNLKWDKGILSWNNEFEILLYHFMNLKNNIYFYKSFWKKIPDTFYIEKNGFFKEKKKSIVGSIARFWVNFKVISRKWMRKVLLKINKVIVGNGIIFSTQADKHLNTGTYVFHDYIMKIAMEENEFYIGLSYTNFSMMKLDPVFFSKSFLVSYSLGFLLQGKNNEIVIIREDGRREVFRPKETEQ